MIISAPIVMGVSKARVDDPDQTFELARVWGTAETLLHPCCHSDLALAIQRQSKRSGGDTWRRKVCVSSKPAIDRIVMSGTAPLRAQHA